MKKLPLTLQSFPDFSARNCIYVDKTAYIHRMLDAGGKFFFLSRPRRFGKSLLLSTIKALFEGRKELFEGLYIYDKISWQTQPVIMFDMSDIVSVDAAKFIDSLGFTLRNIAQQNGFSLEASYPVDLFKELILKLYHTTGRQVVLLVDEYDKPILDVISEPALAAEIREILRSFYTIIKSSDSALHFVLLTGVSKISQTSIFSGLNNLSDITFDKNYSGICGYTQQELTDSFGDYINQLAQHKKLTIPDTLEKIKYWYNGYSWDGKVFVYNPYSVLLLFDKETFQAHWFATGTPSFLIKLLKDTADFSPLLDPNIIQYPGFTDQQALENLDLVNLCFQTGYLTVKSINEDDILSLQVPNFEVRSALSASLLTSYTGKNPAKLNVLTANISSYFAKGNTADAIESLRTLLAQVPYDSHIPQEGFYHALFQLAMLKEGIDSRAEVHTDKGRIDQVLRFENRIYVIEIKYASLKTGLQPALHEAMSQIKDRQYFQPYSHQGKVIHLLALAFTKGAIEWMEELLQG